MLLKIGGEVPAKDEEIEYPDKNSIGADVVVELLELADIGWGAGYNLEAR